MGGYKYERNGRWNLGLYLVVDELDEKVFRMSKKMYERERQDEKNQSSFYLSMSA